MDTLSKVTAAINTVIKGRCKANAEQEKHQGFWCGRQRKCFVCFLQISVSRRQLVSLIHAGLPSIPGAASSLNGLRWQGYYCGVGRLLFIRFYLWFLWFPYCYAKRNYFNLSEPLLHEWKQWGRVVEGFNLTNLLSFKAVHSNWKRDTRTVINYPAVHESHTRPL